MRHLVEYGSLGASLYVPATHPKLSEILAFGISSARSLIVCTEDAVNDSDVGMAVRRLIRAFAQAPSSVGFKRFIRPRNPFVLNQLLASRALVDKLDGVVIPKFDGDTVNIWRPVLSQAPHLTVMPTLETNKVFREVGVCESLAAVKSLTNPVCAVRIGANDLLGALGLKRQSGQSIYDTPLRGTLERIVTQFRGEGFDLAAPVCDLINEPEVLIREVRQDMSWGFFAKTCVHPDQVELVEQLFRETIAEESVLAAHLEQNSSAVFKSNGQMLEQTCHTPWARRVRNLEQGLSLTSEE